MGAAGPTTDDRKKDRAALRRVRNRRDNFTDGGIIENARKRCKNHQRLHLLGVRTPDNFREWLLDEIGSLRGRNSWRSVHEMCHRFQEDEKHALSPTCLRDLKLAIHDTSAFKSNHPGAVNNKTRLFQLAPAKSVNAAAGWFGRKKAD